ncbi:MAG: tetratricopeptide repeat protein, partial [Methanoregulaceae archaeon]|nr:tetratricopeptide repeat protein [Methanoregulaceae archaeon]
MEFNRKKFIELLLTLGIGIVLLVVVSGCSQQRAWQTFSAGTYEAYPFTFSEGERLEVIFNSASAPVNVMILHGGNFSRYQKGEDYVADEYRQGVNSTRIDFYAPVDGEYYLVLENRGPGEAKIDFSYTYHTAAKYETEPVKGMINPVQKHPHEEVPGSLVQTRATTAIPVQTIQPGAVPAQTVLPGMSEVQKIHEEGLLLADEGDLEGALALFDQALKLDPENAGIWNDKGAIHYALGQYGEAVAAAERTTVLEPGAPLGWKNKAVALIGLERYAEALIAAEKATTLKPDYPDAWVNKAVALIGLERYEEALIAAEKALALNPNDAVAWNNKAYALIELDRYTEALAA